MYTIRNAKKDIIEAVNSIEDYMRLIYLDSEFGSKEVNLGVISYHAIHAAWPEISKIEDTEVELANISLDEMYDADKMRDCDETYRRFEVEDHRKQQHILENDSDMDYSEFEAIDKLPKYSEQYEEIVNNLNKYFPGLIDTLTTLVMSQVIMIKNNYEVANGIGEQTGSARVRVPNKKATN